MRSRRHLLRRGGQVGDMRKTFVLRRATTGRPLPIHCTDKTEDAICKEKTPAFARTFIRREKPSHPPLKRFWELSRTFPKRSLTGVRGGAPRVPRRPACPSASRASLGVPRIPPRVPTSSIPRREGKRSRRRRRSRDRLRPPCCGTPKGWRRPCPHSRDNW